MGMVYWVRAATAGMSGTRRSTGDPRGDGGGMGLARVETSVALREVGPNGLAARGLREHGDLLGGTQGQPVFLGRPTHPARCPLALEKVV
jgi:hypothetical protein